ncbi:MAG TPA: homoserine kinase [Candidatus Limnocylindrales bacterium]
MTGGEAVRPADATAYRDLVGRRLTVDVPASSANLGAGYDCLGLALDLTNTVAVEVVEGDGSIELVVTGEGEGDLAPSRDNRFVAGLEAALAVELGPTPAWLGWRITMHNRIPLSRGLGSSAAATVGGVVLGDALACAAGAPAVDPLRLLQIATTIESHPDNAAAVLLGGFVVSAHLGERVEAVRFDAPEGLRCVLFVPERRLSTEDMRRVLPAEVPLRDAVSNMSRIAIGVAGIASGRFELLADLTVDRIHEPYRSVAYPELPALTGAARGAGALGAFLSGAGSTILAFVAPGDDPVPVERALVDAAAAAGLAGRSSVVSPRNTGPTVSAG